MIPMLEFESSRHLKIEEVPLMCYDEGMVMANLRTLVLGIQCEWVLMVFVLVGVGRYLPW